MRSEICAEDGKCWFQAEERSCFDGTKRASTGTMVAGIVIAGVGGAVGFAGLLALVKGGLDDWDDNSSLSSEEEHQLVSTGGVLAGVGFGAALLVGVPMAIIGKTMKERVRGHGRATTTPILKLTPGGAQLEMSF
jgi:hypothetical protein